MKLWELLNGGFEYFRWYDFLWLSKISILKIVAGEAGRDRMTRENTKNAYHGYFYDTSIKV